nr:MAG TPA: hypothetical protein [Bacteriophage sp.]
MIWNESNDIVYLVNENILHKSDTFLYRYVNL